MDRRFFTPADVGRLLGLSPAAVRAAADRGLIRVAANTIAGGRLFSPDDVDAFRRRRAAGRPHSPEAAVR
jgi:DNA-binding transcriptional MerR regulator